jgi:hypothetical protein
MKIFALFLLALSLMANAGASPGAHGPNGEHLDGQANPASAGSVPRVETFSEMFELVGQLSGGEFSVMIDRYETNEPVLQGKLEVQYKGLTAIAKFHPDMGDYAIDDAAFLKALSAPGKHALLFTFIAGDDSDLLEGTLEVSAPAAVAHQHTATWKWVALGLAATALVAVALFIGRRRRKLTS